MQKPTLIIILCVAMCLLFSTCAPLLTYSLTLALFGLAHVLSELRFVDERFGARIKSSYALILALLLIGVICTRSAIVFHLAPVASAYSLELGLVVLLALSAVFCAPTLNIISRVPALLVATVLGCGFVLSPTMTIVILAVAHNLTPMGFILEILPSSYKAVALILCAVLFLIVPLLIASGLIGSMLEPLIGIHENFSVLPTGKLDRHLGVFLPGTFSHRSWAVSGFSAVVFAQCMHYLAVIYVMPNLLKKFTPKEQLKPYLSWPKTRFFWLMVAAITTFLVIFYSFDFTYARSLYGIASAVHAYLEIPILLFALSAIPGSAKQRFLQEQKSH